MPFFGRPGKRTIRLDGMPPERRVPYEAIKMECFYGVARGIKPEITYFQSSQAYQKCLLSSLLLRGDYVQGFFLIMNDLWGKNERQICSSLAWKKLDFLMI